MSYKIRNKTKRQQTALTNLYLSIQNWKCCAIHPTTTTFTSEQLKTLCTDKIAKATICIKNLEAKHIKTGGPARSS